MNLDSAKVEQCASCEAPIVWVRSEKKNKRTPIDAASVPGGNIVANGRVATDGCPLVHYLTKVEKEQPSSDVRYVSHFATCPDGPAWRR